MDIWQALPHELALCLAAELDAERPGLTLAMVFALEGDVDPGRLRRALLVLAERHEALRTRFVRDGEHWLRTVDPAARVSEAESGYCTINKLPQCASEAELTSELERRCRESQDLSAGPLFQARVLVSADAPTHLLVRVHHAVIDLWSVALLLRELPDLYARTGSPGTEGTTAAPDAAQGRPRERSGRAKEHSLAFWRRLWADGCDRLDLPRARRPAPTEPGEARATARAELALGVERSRRLREFATECGVTRYAVLFAAQALALGRLGRSACPPLAVSLHGRGSANLRSVGYELSTVVLPVAMNTGTAREYVAFVGSLLRDALAHRSVGYPDLVDHAREHHGLDVPPPETTLAMFQDPPGMTGLGAALLTGGEFRTGELRLRTVVPPVSVGPWRLATALADRGDQIMGFVETDPAHHPPELAAELARTLPAALDALMANPDAQVVDLEVVSATDRRLLSAWGRAPEMPNIGPDTVHGLLLHAAQQYPDRTAVLADDGELTYRDLARQSAAVAGELRRRGVPTGGTVGILLRRGRHLLPALLGVLRAGCAYVGIDASAPAARRADVLSRAGASLVLTDGSVPDHGTSETASRLSCASLPVEEAVASQAPAPADTATASSPAYAMFTSGSTGRPKGVLISHAAAVNLIRFGSYHFTPEQLTECLAVSGTHFDLSVWELFLPLANGHRVRLVENALTLLEQDEPAPSTFLSSVPSAVATCAHHGALPPGLRLVTMGGDVITGDLVRRIAADCPQAEIVAMYGPTETTTYMTFTQVHADVEDPVPIGRPFGGTTVRVVDENLWDVPIGAVGEALIAGPCVALGYLGEPGPTAARFLPDADGSGGRAYRSGDLVRWRPDGQLEFVGRVDHQVKVRGFRIETGEVESRLRRVAALREALVHAVGSGLDRRLVACLVPAAPVPDDPSDWLRNLRSRLAEHLPSYMVPAEYAIVDELPKNRNGKPDRARIAQLPATRVGNTEGSPPANSVQRRLAGIWQQLLGLEAVSTADDFFEVGGHSLLLARLAGSIREEFRADVSVTRLWNARTITEQEAVIASSAAATGDPRRIQRVDRSHRTVRARSEPEMR
ncbi:non-ribosomal peptide synthetase [Streptomyces yerevanensis]|uniref:non-ribosomal peptide synthetase n=1 Tax=Streptomyces yerevanensis TaxID=66378 RepID=UPI0005251993|nr:non-ribosomal peptide synthetase [Streptomyces yerevanensis]